AGIQGAVTVHNNPSRDTLTIDDSADSGSHPAVTISAAGVTGLAPVPINTTSFSITTLTIFGGSGNNTYAITGTPAVTGVTLNTGSGADAVNVQATSVPVTVDTLSGGVGANSPTSTRAPDPVTPRSAALGATTSTGAWATPATPPGLGGALTTHNTPAYDTVILNDNADSTNRAVTISGAGVTGLSTFPINFTNFSV